MAAELGAKITAIEDREPVVLLAFETDERKGIVTFVFEYITTNCC